jgi:bifunctional non-homologous end joining protein LigD
LLSRRRSKRRDPFDDPEWIFELKYHGFRALAFNGGGTKFMSRRGLEYRRFDDLRAEISLELNADDAVLDREIVKLDESGRPIFIDLMKRRGPFAFMAFDVLAVDGRDIRKMALVARKKVLRTLVPRRSRVILYAGHIRRRGRDLFAEVCRQDLEGIVAKRADGIYDVAAMPGWLKIKNPEYSQARDRAELFKR